MYKLFSPLRRCGRGPHRRSRCGRSPMRGFFRSRSLRRLSLRRKARRCPSRATITSTARTRSAGNGRGRAPECASNPGGLPVGKSQSQGDLRFDLRVLGLRPEGARREIAFRVPQGGAHLRVVRLRTGVHRLARGMGGFRPRHAGPARGGDGRTGRHGGGRRTGRVVFRPPDSLLVSGRAAPYGRFPGAVHQRRDHEPLAHAAAIVAQSDARTPRRGR